MKKILSFLNIVLLPAIVFVPIPALADREKRCEQSETIALNDEFNSYATFHIVTRGYGRSARITSSKLLVQSKPFQLSRAPIQSAEFTYHMLFEGRVGASNLSWISINANADQMFLTNRRNPSSRKAPLNFRSPQYKSPQAQAAFPQLPQQDAAIARLGYRGGFGYSSIIIGLGRSTNNQGSPSLSESFLRGNVEINTELGYESSYAATLAIQASGSNLPAGSGIFFGRFSLPKIRGQYWDSLLEKAKESEARLVLSPIYGNCPLNPAVYDGPDL